MREKIQIKSNFEKESDQRLCRSFKWELVEFIKLMDALLLDKSLAKNASYLDRIAHTVVEIDYLSKGASGCGEDLAVGAHLIQNMLHHPIYPSEGTMGTTLLKAAKDYQKQKEEDPSFCKAMLACVHYDKETGLLIDSLKLIAYDL